MKISENGATGCIYILGILTTVTGVCMVIATMFDKSLSIGAASVPLLAGIIMIFSTKLPPRK